MLDVPRSVRLAAWGTAFLRGRAALDDVVRAVTGHDEPHVVQTPDGDLATLLPRWRRSGVPGLRVHLPVPGDVLGLPGPAQFNRAALDAGECVVTQAAGPTPEGAVPVVAEFGSAWETGHVVTWQVSDVERRAVADLGGLAEADQALRRATTEVADTLARLDVARRRPIPRDGELPPRALPQDVPPRCVRVVTTALRLRSVVDLARRDDGAAVSGYEALHRDQALRRLDDVARRAVVAAVNGTLEAG